ncbi:hypothetical protein Tco_1371501 [Tanacetum coccineum]
MKNLERRLNKETLHEKDSNSDLRVIKVQFDQFIHSKVLEPSNYNSYDLETRRDFKHYTQMEPQTFKEAIIQNIDSIEQCIVERARHEQEIQNRLKRLNERKLQIQECMVQKVKASDASSGEKDYMEKVDSNVIPDSPDMCDNEIQTDHNVVECDDERVALANLIANLKRDIDENKTIQKQLKKANVSLTQELKECKYTLAKTSRTLGESNSIRDSCLVALQNKQTELEKYMAFNDRTGIVKEKTQVITDLKLKEEKDIDKMISMEKQLNFLNEIVYKRNQSIQTIHMLAPKGPTFNGRPTFENPLYLKRAQSEKPCLYEIPHDQCDPVNRLVPNREETLTLERESRSKLNKDLVRPYDYTKLNSLYEIFKPPTQEYLVQLAHANENDSFAFVHELKQEIHVGLKYVESLEKEIDELEFDKAEFSNMYDILLQECVSNDVMCSYLHSLSDLDAHTELQCLYVHKVKECECLAQKLSKQTETVSKEVYNELSRSFAKLEKHSISLELALQQCQEQIKNDTVCKEKASNVFLKEREQYFEIQDLKAQLQDKDIAISELKKLIEKNKGKGVDTNFEKQSILGKPPLQPIRNQPVVRQPTAYKSERSQLPRHRIASQVGVSHDLTKPVTPHSWPQVRKSSFAKPYDVNAPGPSRNSPKHVSFQSPKESVGSNDMVHNCYLKEAKKKA